MVELPIVKDNRVVRALGESQADVLAGFVILVGASMSVLYVDSVVVRAVFGIPLLVFLPGYALLLVLFPYSSAETRVSRPSLATSNRNLAGVTFVERIVLSFGTSLALVPLFGVLYLSIVPDGGAVSVVTLLAVGVGVGLLLGVYRRLQLPKPERYSFPTKVWPATGTNRALNVALAVVVVLSVVGLGAALAVPNYGETYTNLSLVTQQSNGEFVASGYPDTLSAGNSEIYATVTNHEREVTRYTLVVQLQRVETSSGSASVVEYEELARVSSEVAPGETWSTNPELSPEMTGSDLRLVYLLYEGDAPDNADTESAYQSTFVWVDN